VGESLKVSMQNLLSLSHVWNVELFMRIISMSLEDRMPSNVI
jgi:hypothetical protein